MAVEGVDLFVFGAARASGKSRTLGNLARAKMMQIQSILNCGISGQVETSEALIRIALDRFRRQQAENAADDMMWSIPEDREGAGEE